MAGSNSFVQDSGPRAGQHYIVFQHGSQSYRRYDDGTTILIGPSGGTAAAGAGTANVPAAAQPAAPASAPTAASSGVSVQPFATGQDQMGLAGVTSSTALQQAQINQGTGDLAANTTYQIAQNNRTALRSSTDEKDVAAAHGLFNSSIKDGALADIEAQRTIQNNFLTDALTRAQANASTNSGILGQGLTDYTVGYNQQRVQNAQDIANATPPPAAPPAPAPATTPPAAGQPAQHTGASNSFTQSTGSRTGQHYIVFQHGTQSYRRYDDGTTIPIGGSS